MYVNLFFIKKIKASINDSRKTIKQWHSAANYYLDVNTNTLLKGNLDENSVEPGQTAQICMLAWLYASGKHLHDLPLACTPTHVFAHTVLIAMAILSS